MRGANRSTGDRDALRAWATQGSLAITDEALISGSNFALGIVLARWLNAEQYGAYALAFSLFLLLGVFHQAILLEPMSVFGPAFFVRNRRQYLAALLSLHAGMSALILLALGGSSLLAARLPWGAGVSEALAGLAIGAPFILLFWTARAACYLELAPGRAAAGALIYSALLLGGLCGVCRWGKVAPFTVFLLMGSAALVVSVVMLVRLRPSWKGLAPVLRDAWRWHWDYGRWALGTALATWVPGNIFYLGAGALLGVGNAGALRALNNFILPVHHCGSALGRLFQPHVSRAYGRKGAYGVQGPVRNLTLLFAAGGAAYAILFSLFHAPLFRLLYGGKYAEYSWLVSWATAGAVFQVAAYGPSIGLRAMQAPSSLFAGFCAAAAVAILGGIPAIRLWGLPGAVGASAAATLTAFAITQAVFRRKAEALAGQNPGPASRMSAPQLFRESES